MSKRRGLYEKEGKTTKEKKERKRKRTKERNIKTTGLNDFAKICLNVISKRRVTYNFDYYSYYLQNSKLQIITSWCFIKLISDK